MHGLFKGNLQGLILDSGIIIYTHSVLYGPQTGGAGMLEGLPASAGFILVFCMQAMFPFAMGRIMASYDAYFDSRFGGFIERSMKFFFGITIFFIFTMGFYIAKHFGIKSGAALSMSMLCGAVFALVSGGIAGYSIYEKRKEKKSGGEIPGLGGPFFFIAVLNGYAVLMVCLVDGLDPAAGAVYGGASTVLLFCIYRVMRKTLPAVMNSGLIRRRGRLAGKLLFSLALATLFCFWLELLTVSMLKKGGGEMSAFMVLMITGYLPLRVFIEFEPPLSPATALTGIASAAFFICRM